MLCVLIDSSVGSFALFEEVVERIGAVLSGFNLIKPDL